MRALWLVPALALTLTACGSNPASELRADVEAVTLAANDRSAAGVRDAVDELLATIRAQVASNELDRAEGERLRAIALRIAEQAGLLEPSPSPSPVEEQTEEPSPEPEPSPEEPSPEPEPSPEEEEEEPEPSPQEQEPEPEQSVEVVVPPVEESPPSAQSQTGAAPSAEPTPA